MDHYRFANVWHVGVPAEVVFTALTDLAAYPLWWPDVRAVSRVDDDTAEIICKAMLPYTLVLRMTRAEQDLVAGRLRVALSGDLEGTLACMLTEHQGGTRLDIEQHVVASKPLLRRLSLLARPVFRGNHGLMMRRGQRGLRAYVALAPG